MNSKDLAPHLLKALFLLQSEGTPATLETLTEALRVRRTDVRRAVTALHGEGLVDALRMRLTLRGLALGAAFAGSALRPLRRAPLRLVSASASASAA
jgi:DNA-binding Lrp family transcriptional regulator